MLSGRTERIRSAPRKFAPAGRVLRITLLLAVALVVSAHPKPAAAAGINGAPIVIAGDVSGQVDIFNGPGTRLEFFDGNFTISDGLGVGDVDGDGMQDIVIAGDVSGIVDIFDITGRKLGSFNGNYTLSDGFAVGDVMGDGRAEILVAGDFTGIVDIFDNNGNKLASFDGDYTIADGFATGDVNNDGKDEILIAGDVTGTVDIFRSDGSKWGSFDGDYTIADGFAAGDVDGDGFDEIVIGGDVTGTVDVFAGDGTKESSFDGNFTISDGLAVGDVTGDAREEILIAGDVSGTVDVFSNSGSLLRSFEGNYTISDGFAVGAAEYPDQDGDGLLDGWETFGYDADLNGTIDVNLPAFGADPLHKDLFVEYDWTAANVPTQAEMLRVKSAFAAAPINAGGVNNPDGQPGINLWIDTGGLTDPAGLEDGVTANSCSDGLDNDGDTLIDAADPNCLVADNLGGGNLLNTQPDCLGTVYYNTKANNFAGTRNGLFRYAVAGDASISPTCGGGRGEIGGNDFIEYNGDGGTFMHELGHNLNLHHGGDDDNNCKPPYVSVMDYDLQFGISQADGSQAIYDYSPPRFAGGRGVAPLATIAENALNEGLIFDGADPINMFAFTNAGGAKVQSPVNGDVNGDGTADGVDWNGDGSFTNGSSLTVNVDTSATSNGRPAACTNGATNSSLDGFNDWNVVAVSFRGFEDKADGAVNPVLEPEPDINELQDIWEALNTTDLEVSMSDSTDPAVAGTLLDYNITVANRGPNPANEASASVVLPAGVTYQSSTGAACVEAPTGTLTCDLGSMRALTSQSFSVRILIAADLVHNNGSPLTITNQVSVKNGDFPDSDPADNATTEDTLVVAVADLDIVSFTAVGPPGEVIVGQDIVLNFRKVITNHGPSAPMDVRITQTATPPTGATVTPANKSILAAALGLDEQREVLESFTIRCLEASHHLFKFENDIAPDRPDDSDPNPANNHAEITLDIECVVPVAINIKPRSYPNAIRPGEGGIPVAVLTTKAGEYGLPLAFDATAIDPLSVVFSPRASAWLGIGASEVHAKGHIEDSYELDEKTRDGDQDMVLHFDAPAAGIVPGVIEACVKGQWKDGNGQLHKFFGCDSVKVTTK